MRRSSDRGRPGVQSGDGIGPRRVGLPATGRTAVPSRNDPVQGSRSVTRRVGYVVCQKFIVGGTQPETWIGRPRVRSTGRVSTLSSTHSRRGRIVRRPGRVHVHAGHRELPLPTGVRTGQPQTGVHRRHRACDVRRGRRDGERLEERPRRRGTRPPQHRREPRRGRRSRRGLRAVAATPARRPRSATSLASRPTPSRTRAGWAGPCVGHR